MNKFSRLSSRPRLTASLLPLARNWRRAVDAALTPLGISEALAAPLIFLGRSGGDMSQNDLAEMSGLGGPGLVRVLDRLEARGLVERKVDAQDKRLRRLTITAQGKAMADDMERTLDSVRNKVLSGVTDAQIATCLDVITRMNAAIEELREEAGQAIPPA